jgi:hypothetical protein
MRKHLYTFKSFMVNRKFSWKLVFFVTGLVSTLWFLVRVIPKPSRAAYPCMRAAAPFMSGFVLYLTGLFAGLFVFKKSLAKFRAGRYLAAFVLLTAAVLIVVNYNPLIGHANPVARWTEPETFIPNQPVGVAMGVNPGRVVLVHDADATNKFFVPGATQACYFVENVDSAIINRMTLNAVLSLTGKTDIKEAWDELFRYFNSNHGKGNNGYQAGEKVFIKINCNSAWGHPSVTGNEFNILGSSLGRNLNEDYSFKSNVPAFGTHDGGPYVMLSVLKQLIYDAGVPEDHIYIGDPMRDIHKYNFDILRAVFPAVHYIGHSGTFYRTTTAITSDTTVFFSDKGNILRNNENAPLKGSKIFSVIKDADYIINIAALKAHSGEGMTSCAKNYFGAIGRVWANEMHNGMVSPNFNMSSRAVGSYRVLVDLMGHKDLGGKTMLFLVDGTFFSPDAFGKPVKFQKGPYNNDWCSSVLASQDMVAIESVCFDMISGQYQVDCAFPYIAMRGICEHLEQAADPARWPAGISYDPEKDGTPLTSLGVYEHWNNATDRQYSRNLGTGNGIELIQTGPVEGLIAHPIQLAANIISGSEIEITWKDNSDRETGYSIEVSAGDRLHYIQVADLSANSQTYNSTGLQEGTRYYYRVRAYDETAVSGYSNEISCIAGAPSGLQADPWEPELLIRKTENHEILLTIPYEPAGNTSVHIYSSSGKLVESQQFFKPAGTLTKNISLPARPEGIYMIQVKSNLYSVTRKIIMD